MTPLNLYSGEPQHDTFPYLTSMFPVGELRPSTSPHVFPDGDKMAIPESFKFDGQARSSEGFLADTDTAALLVIKDGAIRFEDYWLTGERDVQWISWSVAKSFVSALVGIAIDEGHIGGIKDSISQHVPELSNLAYDGVSIEAVLETSSGARWNEDYSDPGSDVNRFAVAITGGGSLLDFVSGMVTDCGGVEITFGGLNLTARDYAKLGELYRPGGKWNREPLVPRDWVKSSVNSNAPHLANGKVIVGGHVFRGNRRRLASNRRRCHHGRRRFCHDCRSSQRHAHLGRRERLPR